MTDDDRVIEGLRADLRHKAYGGLLQPEDYRDGTPLRAELLAQRARLAALDSLLAERERMRAAIVELQAMAAGKYAHAMNAREYAQWAGSVGAEEAGEVAAESMFAAHEGAVLSSLVRRALGVEP